MLKTRVIPCLLLKNQGLVKTVRFKDPKYVGDPINTVKIFNEKEVDELLFLDITASAEKRRPNLHLIADIASEAFMPVGYGGGIQSLNDVYEILKQGVEKVIINKHAVEEPSFVSHAAEIAGSQSIVISLDVKKLLFGGYEVVVHNGKKGTGKDPVSLAKEMQERGAGELFINAVDRDGTQTGYDLALIKRITEAVSIPVVVCGGAGSLDDFAAAVRIGGASAVAAGSMFVFHGRHRAVLITYPSPADLSKVLP